MRIFAALVWREILERRLLLLVSAFLGLVPIVMPWLPWLPGRLAAADLRSITALVLTGLFGCLLLLILGSTLFGRDLSEDRLGFYYSRPISSWTLWTSRLVAACALLLAAVILMILPVAFLGFDPLAAKILDWRPGWRPGHAWPLLGFSDAYALGASSWQSLPESPPIVVRSVLAVAAVFSLLALVHAASTIVRGRSAWMLADLAGLAAVVVLGWGARDQLVSEEALGALVWAEWLLLPWLLGSLLLAGAVQLQRGRTDLQRGHRYLSATLWPALIVGVLAFGGYARWVAGSHIEDLEEATYVRASPNEAWLVAGGPVRYRAGAQAAFLREVSSGRSWRLGSFGSGRWKLAFSKDGGTAAWVRCQRFRPLTCKIWTKALDDASPPEPTEIETTVKPRQIVLSDDGTRIAVNEARRVSVYDLSSARLLAAVAAVNPTAVFFLSSNRLRFHELIWHRGGPIRKIRQLDLDSRQLIETGRLPKGAWSRQSARGEVVLVARNNGFGLYRGETGQPLVEVRGRRPPRAGTFLADGRLVLCFTSQQRSTDRPDGRRFEGLRLDLEIRILSAAGRQLQQVFRQGVMNVRFGGELSPGRLLIALQSQRPEPSPADAPGPDVAPMPGWTTHVLDVETGELTRLAVGLIPLSEAAGTRLFEAGGDQVLLWDPRTGEHRTILPPGQAAGSLTGL